MPALLNMPSSLKSDVARTFSPCHIARLPSSVSVSLIRPPWLLKNGLVAVLAPQPAPFGFDQLQPEGRSDPAGHLRL